MRPGPEQYTHFEKTNRKYIWLTFFVLLAIGGLVILLGLQGARETGPNWTCMNNARNIGNAMLNYLTQTGPILPLANIRDEAGHSLHSWRLTMLPLLDQNALYRTVDQSQPWNASINEDASMYPLRVFYCVSRWGEMPDNGTSFYTITGEETLFPDEGSINIEEVEQADGMAHTILITESTMSSFSWMEPRDIPFWMVTKTPAKMLGYGPSSVHEDGVNVTFADGASRTLSHDTDPAVLRALITWNGSESLPEEF